MNFLESPLYQSFFNDNVPRILIKPDVPDFTIIDYNESFKAATYTVKRNVRGQSIWAAYPKDDANTDTKILEEGLEKVIRTGEKSQLPPFQYDVPSADMLSIEQSWWQVEIEPIANKNKEVNFLHVKLQNITEKVKGNNNIHEYIRREEMLTRKLSETYEELALSNKVLQANLAELRSANEALATSRSDLKNLNAELENKILDRTKDLQESRLLLQNIVSTANVAMTLLKGEELVIELPNHKMLQIWQRPLEEVDGKFITDVFPELKEQMFPKLLADVFKTGKRIAMPEVPVDISFPNGEMKLIYVNFSYDPIFGTDGKVEYILATVNDITVQVENFKQLEESKSDLQAMTEELAASNEELLATNEELATTNEELLEAQENLRFKNEVLSETEESLRLALDSGNLGTYSIFTGTGKFEVSQKARDFYGFPRDKQVSWADITSMVIPDYLPVIENARINALATNEPFDVQYPITSPNTNKVKWMRVVGKSVQATNLKPSRFMGVIMDITNEVEHRLAIEESEARFRNMAEATDVLIAVDNQEGKTTYFNNAWCGVTGRSVTELLNSGWSDLIHPDDIQLYNDIYASAFMEKGPFTCEFRISGADETYRWLLTKGTPRFDSDGQFMGYISSSIDISELKKDEVRKNDFIGMVSHELKTPLTAISGFIQVLQAKARKTNDEYSILALGRAYNQVKKMGAMINGFLNVSRLESGKLLIEKTHFQLDELLMELVDESEIIQFSHEIRLHLSQPLSVFADRDKIGSVISNLLSNAVKYSAAGTQIDVACEVISDKALVSISDKGIGIDAEDIEKLFDRYYRVNKQHTVSGFGIGLYLSAEIIERHNGTIGVKSETGKGSTFYFEIPLSEESTIN